MRGLYSITPLLLIVYLSWTQSCKLVCYYDILGPSIPGALKFTSKDLEIALRYCTHVVYSYVAIKPDTFSVTTLPVQKQRELEKMIYFKNKFPNVKFLLSIGDENSWENPKRFLNLLQQSRNVQKLFIKSAVDAVIRYKFDGLSLDFPLPKTKPKLSSTYAYGAKILQNFLNFFRSDSGKEANEIEHKTQLTILIQRLSTYLREHNLMLSLNVLPNIDSKKYFDISVISNNLDMIVLSAFDFYTPRRNPNETDYAAPIKPPIKSEDRLPLTNIEDLYNYWVSQNTPRHKIIIGVATYGRSWKMTKNSNTDGIPPVLCTNGPGDPGPQTHAPGFLSWPEICRKLSNDHKLIRVKDFKAKSGVYAYRAPENNDRFGIWISYDDPITAAEKAQYVRDHNLGGVALVKLGFDDIHGECGEKFPILRSIKFRLSKYQS